MEIRYPLKPLLNKPLSFFRKVQLGISLGLVLSFFLVGVGVFYQQYLNVKHQLQSQGISLTANLARNAEPFLVDYDKDQLNQFLSVMLDNPLVLFSGIINTHLGQPKIDVLQKQDSLDLKFVTEIIRTPSYQRINLPKTDDIFYMNQRIIYCISPIFSQFVFPDDETTLLYNQPRYQGIVGYSVIAYKLPFSAIFSQSLTRIISWFIIVAIFVGGAVGTLIAQGLMGRIKRIGNAVQAYKIGDSLNISDTSQDEVGAIANALSDMATLVNIQLNQIKASREELSKKVAAQLTQINELNQVLTRYSQNQRLFVAQRLQEVHALFLLLPDMVSNKNCFNQMTRHLQYFIAQVIYMLQDNQEFSVIRQLQKVKVSDILNTHEELLTWLAARNNNKFKILISDEKEITTDPNQLLQSLIQLILNASKYTQDGIITCEITGHGAHQSIAISDNGQGMLQDDVNAVITSLDQDDLTLVDAFSTLGLGLVVVHRFCRNIQAKLICTSEKGVGTTIEIVHLIQPNVAVQSPNRILCITNEEQGLKQVQSNIQKVSNWSCDVAIYEDGIKLDHQTALLIDLNLGGEAIFKIIKQYFQDKIAGDLILYYKEKIILVSGLIKPQKNHMDWLSKWLPSDKKTIYMQTKSLQSLDTKSVFEHHHLITEYSYRHNIDFRITDLKNYSVNLNEKVVLVVSNVSELKAWIEKHGQYQSDISSSRLFSYRG